MSLSTPLKAVALIVFLAALAGATYGVNVVLGDNTAALAVTVETLGEPLNVTPGHSATLLVRLNNRGDAAQDLVAVVSGLGAEARSGVVTAFAGSNRTAFVTFPIPQDATPGDHALTLKVLDAAGKTLRERPDAARLRVLSPGAGFASGDSAEVVYVGRLAATGNVFSTNEPALIGQTFGSTESFQPNNNPRVLTVQTVPRVSVVPGFYEGILGMQEGESRSFTFGPEKGYGNATVEQTEERVTTIPRNETLPLPTAELDTAQFADYLRSNNLGSPENYTVGSIVTNDRDGEILRYRITQKDDAGVKLVLDVQVGERYTLYDVWPGSSVVESVDGLNVTFRTDPSVAVDEAFTYHAQWPNMSRITSMDETAITIQHSPPVGFTYAEGVAQAARTYTVKEVRDDAIVVTTPSTNQLAGKDLAFDVRLVKLTKGSG